MSKNKKAEIGNHKCDICGKAASNAAIDIKEMPIMRPWVNYEPYGKPKYGCDKHPTCSERYGADGTIER